MCTIVQSWLVRRVERFVLLRDGESVRALARRRNAVFVLLFVPGLTISSWVSRTPDVRDLLQVSTEQMGLVLFGMSVGSMAGIVASGPAVLRWGARRVVLLATLSIMAGAAVMAVGVAAATPLVVSVGLGLFGLGMGGGEVGVNVEGADVEARLGRSTLPAMHGFFSLGTVLGAASGMVLTAVAVPADIHLGLVAAADAFLLAVSIRHISQDTGRRPSRLTGEQLHLAARPIVAQRPRSAPRPVWRDPRLLALGVVILALAAAEGTANDWLPLVMVDGHHLDPALGSGVYVIFALAMTIGRFAGGRLVDRVGRVRALGASAAIGALGIAAVIFLDNPLAASGAVILWGLGASLGFPVALSAAGDTGDDPAARVSVAAVIGYAAFLVGPPSLGFLGQHHGLRHALLAVLGLVLVAIAVIPVVEHMNKTRRHQAVVAERDEAKQISAAGSRT